MAASYGVVVFPGTWSDTDWRDAIEGVLGAQAEYVFHKETDVSRFDCLVVPGGFSYGDYLRPGAIARFSPVMRALSGVRGGGRPGDRQLQRVPGALRVRVAARRADAQRQPGVPLPAAAPARGARRRSVHLARARGRRARHPRLPRRRQLLRGRRDARAHGGERADRVPLLRRERGGDAGGEPERLARQHRGRHERGGERAWAHAAPGAGGGGGAGRHGRPAHPALDRRGAP